MIEECDLGSLNGQDGQQCTTECTVPECGDGIEQEWLGEECDDGDEDHGGGNLAAAPADLTKTWCKLSCKRPECSNGRDQADVGEGGGEDVPDELADDADGGCYKTECDFDSGYLPGKDNESNPCLVQRPGGSNSSLASTKQLGESCGDSSECIGYQSGSSNRIRCMSYNRSEGTCTDMGSEQYSRAEGLIEVSYAAGGGFNPPVCVPGVCGFFVGDEAACGGAFQNDQSCDAGRLRQQCLFNTAVAQGQCPGGEIVPVDAGEDVSCLDGQAPNQQKMCGPGGKWFCKCPGDNPNVWQEQFQACGPKCGDNIRDAGEACDDGNLVDGDGCSSKCAVEPGNQCAANACDGGGAPVCAQNEVCQVTNQLPCLQCVPQVGGVCTGTECADGGDAAAAAQGMQCSLIGDFPCITFIPPNSCGNGEINVQPPQTIDDGCEVTGTAGQYCVNEGFTPDDFGQFLPNNACFQGAHCKNTGGMCGWEMTPDLQRCFNDAARDGGGLPPGCFCGGGRLQPGCPVDFAQDPCGSAQAAINTVPLTAQAAGGSCFVTLDVRMCCDDAGMVVGHQSRACPGNVWGSCTAGSVENCAAARQQTCVRAGCNGELCVAAGTAPDSDFCSVSQESACYANAVCEQVGTGCGWRQTTELQQCLTNNAASGCSSGQACLGRSQCTAEGGTVGNSCGTDGTSVCCGNVITQDAVEQCDDGNRIDGDACGNDCQINCKGDADCPEGACVDGQCVAQCVAPDPDPDPTGGGSDPLIGRGCPATYPYCGVVGGATVNNGGLTGSCPAGQKRDWDPAGVTGCALTTGTTCFRCVPDTTSFNGDFLSRMMASQSAIDFSLLP